MRLSRPSLGFYRYLYDTVGAPHVWWLRRAMPDAALAGILDDPAVSIHVLYRGGEPAGFFELDGRSRPDVNLSYFGLLPHAVGPGFGGAFLRAAVDEAFARTRPRRHGQHLHRGPSARAADLSPHRVQARSARSAKSGTCRPVWA